MDSFTTLMAVLLAILLGAMSPGPSFLVVARTAVASSRARGILAALGMGFGGAAFALAALLGLQLLLTAVPALYKALQVLGAAYLLLTAYRLGSPRLELCRRPTMRRGTCRGAHCSWVWPRNSAIQRPQ